MVEVDQNLRDRLYDRALEEQNHNLWNFKRYYAAASFWSTVDLASDVFLAGAGAILTYGLAWQTLPLWAMVSLSLSVGAISIFKGNRKPGKRSEKIHTVGRRYHRLYDDLQDFIELDLKNEDKEEQWLRERFEELASRRHELRNEMSLNGFWYTWIKWRRGDEIYDEAGTSEKERQLLDPDSPTD